MTNNRICATCSKPWGEHTAVDGVSHFKLENGGSMSQSQMMDLMSRSKEPEAPQEAPAAPVERSMRRPTSSSRFPEESASTEVAIRKLIGEGVLPRDVKVTKINKEEEEEPAAPKEPEAPNNVIEVDFRRRRRLRPGETRRPLK